MAHGVDPRLTAAAHGERRFANDRACVGCGYNLRGLIIGAACPECGLRSRKPNDFDSPLSTMPLHVIRRFNWASAAAALACLGLVGSFALTFGLQVTWAWIAWLSSASLWILATFWLTPAMGSHQAQHYGFTARNPLRHCARWLQTGWIATILLLISSMPGASVLAILAAVVGVTGTICMCLILQELANWARDDSAHTALNHAMWGLPIGTASLIWIPTGGGIGGVLTGAASGALCLYGFAALIYGVFSLSRSIGYTVGHAYEIINRQERQNARQERWEERRAAMVRKADAAREERGTGW